MKVEVTKECSVGTKGKRVPILTRVVPRNCHKGQTIQQHPDSREKRVHHDEELAEDESGSTKNGMSREYHEGSLVTNMR